MWHWLTDNHGAVSALATCLTLIVWFLYFHLLYRSFHNAQRPKILITIAGGPKVDAECIIANMSKEPIYVEAVIASTQAGDGSTERFLSDLDVDAAPADFRRKAMQGTLASGEMINLGSFRALLAKILPQLTAPDELFFSLTAVAVYAGEDRLVGAQRSFVLRGDRLTAASPEARQLRSARERRELSELMTKSDVIDRS